MIAWPNCWAGFTTAYFSILLCLMPDNFIHEGKSAGAQWVNGSGTILAVKQ
jgi:hypothetical protein